MSSNKQQPAASSALSGTRHLLLAFVVGYMYNKYAIPLLYPCGFAVPVPPEERPVFAPIDPQNDGLRFQHGKTQKIYERVLDGQEPIMKGPETVVIDPHDGTIYVLTEEAKLVRLDQFEQHNRTTIFATATPVVDLGVGRPLGGTISPHDGTLYVADTLLGLIRVRNLRDPSQRFHVELVASRVWLDETQSYSPLRYTNDVAVGPKTGKVYFTDSTDIAPDRIGTRTWDTLYMSKWDYVRGARRGRVLEYDPRTDRVRVVASGLAFANGIAVDAEETYLVVSETFRARSLRYDLSTGERSVLADGLTGYPDGCDCNHATGLCYAPMPSAGLKLMKKVHKLPNPIDRWVRNLLMTLPRKVAPAVVPYGGVVEMDPVLGSKRILQDPNGQDVGMMTGATVYQNKLYLGSLKNKFVAVYDLN